MIHVVIPHYIATEELETLARNTIKSMRETSDVFIVSVDDGSPRDTTFLKEISDKVLTNRTNKGFAKTCNKGFRWAMSHGADYIICANNDIEVFKGWLEALKEPFSMFEKVGLTGLISSKERNLYGTLIKDYKKDMITEGGMLEHWMQSGGLWMSTSEVLKDVGLFDERFETGGEEDIDLFLRIRDPKDYKIIMSGRSMFWHKEGATRWNDEIEKGFKDKNKAIEQVNYDKFAKKWGFDIRKDGLRFYEVKLWPKSEEY